MRSLTSWSSWPTAARSSRRIEPEPPPELILSRTNVTAVETLPAGALLGCRLITAAVTFHKPPGAQNEKLVGADSTANSKGGMCMERVEAGKYSVWVQDPVEAPRWCSCRRRSREPRPSSRSS